jgi:cellulose synthase/poly-beta-1,6-N-acetylglucosamine synthase-like glycosyltransferase
MTHLIPRRNNVIGILGWICAAALMSLTVLAVYQWLWAIVALLPWRRRNPVPTTDPSRLVVVIPAHNEERVLGATLTSLARVDYPRDRIHVVVVADRCDDRTAELAREYGAEPLERRDGLPGKGSAIAWAIDQLRLAGRAFDGLVIVDADTVVDRWCLAAFDEALRSGCDVQQGYNTLSNPWESAFTRIIAVTSVLRNRLFYDGKERLGVPAMLSGTGMCFSRRIIDTYGWSALSVGEDWECSVSLLLNGEKIHFTAGARVMARESSRFSQAAPQRLRWASGRHGVAVRSAVTLLTAGIRRRRPELWDAALTILAPPYSVQATLTFACVCASWFLSSAGGWPWLLPWALAVTGLLAGYFVAGLAVTEAPLRALAGIIMVPVFLPWRTGIEILGLIGYGRRHWVRTSRH